jgi:hypothetical protein
VAAPILRALALSARLPGERVAGCTSASTADMTSGAV